MLASVEISPMKYFPASCEPIVSILIGSDDSLLNDAHIGLFAPLGFEIFCVTALNQVGDEPDKLYGRYDVSHINLIIIAGLIHDLSFHQRDVSYFLDDKKDKHIQNIIEMIRRVENHQGWRPKIAVANVLLKSFRWDEVQDLEPLINYQISNPENIIPTWLEIVDLKEKWNLQLIDHLKSVVKILAEGS